MSEENQVERCNYSGCTEDWALSCDHGRWCGVHVVAHQRGDDFCRKALAQAMLKLYRKFFLPMFRLREELLPATCVLLEGIASFAPGFCAEVSAACRGLYESEGEPYGAGDEAMWRWIEEQLEHTVH